MTISTQRDIRITIISRIWAYATAMLLISILLNGQGRRGALFLSTIIVLSATASTIVVLRRLHYHQHDTLFPSETLKKFEQRIENLEAIAASDTEHGDYSSINLTQ